MTQNELLWAAIISCGILAAILVWKKLSSKKKDNDHKDNIYPLF